MYLLRSLCCWFLLVGLTGCGGSNQNQPLPKGAGPKDRKVALELRSTSAKQTSNKEVVAKDSKVVRVNSLISTHAKAMEDVAAAVGQVSDDSSALKAAEVLKTCAGRMRELIKEINSLGKLTKEENAQVSAKPLDSANAAFSKGNKVLGDVLKSGKLSADADKAVREALVLFATAASEIGSAYAAALSVDQH